MKVRSDFLAQLPPRVRPIVKCLAPVIGPFDLVRWTVRGKHVWITEGHWILRVGPASDPECRPVASLPDQGYTFEFFFAIEPGAPAPLRWSEEARTSQGKRKFRGDTESDARDVVPCGRAWLASAVVRLVEAACGPCSWHPGKDNLDIVSARDANGERAAYVMPMRVPLDFGSAGKVPA